MALYQVPPDKRGVRFCEPKTTWGITGGRTLGDRGRYTSSGVEPLGEIDYDSLNRRRFTDVYAYNDFYQSIRDFVMARLGHPVVRVELTDFQILTTIDEAVSKLDYHAPDWCQQMLTFITEANISLYKFPSFVINNLVDVAYKKTLLSVAREAGTLEFDFFIKYFQENFLFSDFHVSDFLLMQMHLEQIRKILGRDGSFSVINNEMIQVFPTPLNEDIDEVVVTFKSLDSDTLHHYFVNWIQRYALAASKCVLGEIRGKYAQLPSPAGGAILNGAALIQQGKADLEQLMQELNTEIEEPPAFSTW